MLALGLFLIFLSSLLGEFSDSVGKKQISLGKENLYFLGFINYFWAALFFLVIGLVRDSFVFSLASLPTLLPRLVLEVAQAQVGLMALVRADRSTFSFLRILTIPLLLIVDLWLGYRLSLPQLLGLGIITIGIIFVSRGLSWRGSGYALFTAINAVATISLYKYDITHFNSVEAEQGIVTLVLLLYFLTIVLVTRPRDLLALKQPLFLGQYFSIGAGTYLASLAYNFAPASIITGAKRAFDILTAIFAGHFYFKEKHFMFKLLALGLIVIGLGFMFFAT
ncbi:MAG: hypothetical protein AAB455_02260 [Patescibacteria group bacterium]